MNRLILSLFVLVLIAGSCDLAELNENEKDPTDVPGDPLFSNAQTEYGTFIHNTNVNVNIFKLIAQHWTTTTYTAEPRYEITNRAIPDNIWIIMYRDVLNDLQEARIKIEENQLTDEAVKQNKFASIKVMKALAYSSLVNIFGNIPYEEALNPENTQPTYQDAETIYVSLIDSLNTAIDNFDPSAVGFGQADIYYNGDIEQWQAFANSVKMRLAITLADVNPELAETAIQEASPNAFTSIEDNALIPFQSSPPHTNPVWEALVQSGRDDYLPAITMVDIMNNLDDPRRSVFMDMHPDSNAFVGAPYGEVNDYPAFSHFSEEVERRDRPGTILSYSEVEFIRAEAAARGYTLPEGEDVVTHYENGIRADMEFWGVSDSAITAYINQPEVAYDPTGDFREQIGTQKWLSLFLQGLQAWTSYRRLDAPNLVLPPETSVDAVPTRFTYPADEQVFNEENYNEAASAIGGDQLTTPLFWDVNDN